MASFSHPAHKGQLKIVIDEDQTMFSVENGSGLAAMAGTTKESANVSLFDAKVEGKYRINLHAERPGNNKPATAGIGITDKYGDITWKQTAK